MPASPVDIRPLCPERLNDFLQFFDGPAFADNPRWASCYCQCMLVDHREVRWTERSAETNRQAACEGIADGRMQGYLAYRDGQVVGWCQAAPRLMLAALHASPDPDAASLGQITCFVVTAAHRRTGVATALLDAACAGLKAQGLSQVEAQPSLKDGTEAELHCGPLGLYLAAGFQVHHSDDDGDVFLRRVLA